MRDFYIGNARWLCAGAALTFLSSFGQTFFISVFSGEIRGAFGLSHAAWGGIYTLGTGLSAVAMVWAGGLADRYRSRALGTAVLLLLAASCLAMALNPVAALLPVVIFALRFTGQGMMSHIAAVSMARWFAARRGRALSISALGVNLGEAALPVAMVAAMAFVDWRLLWVAVAILCLAAIPALRALLSTERTPQSMAKGNATTGMGGRHWQRREVLRHWLFWAMVPALVAPPAFITAFFFQQVPFAAAKGWEHLALVALFPIFPAASLVSLLVSGWLIDRFGTGRVIPWHHIPLALAFALHAVNDDLALVAVALVLMGLSHGAVATMPIAFWSEFYGTQHIGSIKAMAVAVMVAATALGPGITGLMLDAGIRLEAQYGAMAAYFTGVTILMAVAVRRAMVERNAIATPAP